ncbi:MAG TPA: tail fiber protein [Candidatus Angelobacter sp.]|jgi:microcystin-dependent protein
MSDQFVAEIRIFAGNFAPTGWALCNGQLMPISQNTALFSLLGTTYGGDGKSNFALPNLQGAAPLQAGQGPGLSLYDLGETIGSSSVTLITTEIPAHSHGALAVAAVGASDPTNNAWASGAKGFGNVYSPSVPATNVQMAPTCLSIAGGSLPHNNMMPYLCLTFIIALQGIFPPRS